MANVVPLTVKIADLPEVTEAFERAAQEIERLRREAADYPIVLRPDDVEVLKSSETGEVLGYRVLTRES